MIPHVAADKLSIRAAAALGLGGVALYVGSYLLWWPLVFIGLAPAAAAFRGLERDRTALAFALVIGWLAMFLVQQSLWAFHTSAVAVLAAYQALTWLPVAFGIRAVWRRWRVPLTFAWPVAWTAGECLRLLGMLGSPFGGIYVPCAAQPVLLQIGELGGIHLASFPVAMAQGWFADTLLRNLDGARERKGFCWPTRAATLAAVATWATVLIFGVVRYRQMEASVRPGPRLAMIQSDIPHVAGEPPTYDPNRLLAKLQRLSEEAVAQGGPVDLVVWPEGAVEYPMCNRAFFTAEYDPRMDPSLGVEEGGDPAARWRETRAEAAEQDARFAAWVRKLGVPVVVGLTAYLPSPPEDGEPFRSYNAAVRYDPETGQADNFQSKIRLYPGGEYAPWEGTFLEAILGRPGKAFTPGEVRHVYRLGAARHPYVVNVCSEMKFPIFRGRLEPAPTGPETRRPFAFIVSLANEGLFQRNHAQVELRDCTIYRAIERRVGVARSSNSGVSGFASPSGRLYSMVTNRLGQTRALLGSPELPLIRDTIEFRTRNRDAFATNATLRAELERRMGEIEAARERAGIEGWTVDQVLISDTDTLFERLGDWLSPVTFLLLAAMNLAGLPPRRKVQRVSSTG